MARRANARMKYEYIDGNTVRELEPYAIPKQRELERRREAQRKAKIRHNRQRQMAIDAGFMLFLTVAVIATLLVCINFIKLKADVERATTQVAQKQEEIIDLRAKNDAAYNRVLTSINLDAIKKVALEEYGMVPAGKDQISTYRSNEEDYMTQYKAVTK